MPRSLPTRWITLLVFGALTAFGCVGTTDTGSQSETGSLAVDLVLAGGIEIDEVGWQITGNGMDMSGDINVSAPGSTASVEVFGLPPGDEDYTVMLTATSTDGQVTCRGSHDFNVEVGESTEVMVFLNCKKPRTRGAVRVNGEFNYCTQLTKAVVSPLETSVGNDISLAAQAVDVEGDPITYIWTGTGGSIADPSAASTTYTCQEVGSNSVTIMVTDNDEYCRMATWTVPVTCVPGDSGAGGAGGSAGAGGSGGTTGDGGSGGEPGGGGAGGEPGGGGAGGEPGGGGAGGTGGTTGGGGAGGEPGGGGAGGTAGGGGGGAAGAGGAPVECEDNSNCPQDGNECTLNECTANMCNLVNEPSGKTCEGTRVCDGAGQCVDCLADADCPQDDNQCTLNACTAQICGLTNLAADVDCDQDGSFCDGAGGCVQCNMDSQCDVELNETCVDNTCIAVAQACGSQTQTVSVGCTNNVTTAQSPFPFIMTVDAPVAILGGAVFSVDLTGIGFFPEFFLDAAQGVVCGGIRAAELLDFVSTVQVRSGASGPDVPLGLDLGALSPGPLRFCNFPTDLTCTCPGGTPAGGTCPSTDPLCLGGTCGTEGIYQDLPVINGTPNSPGGCDFDASGCPGTPGPPTDCDCSACAAIDIAPATTKADQCAANGFCQDAKDLALPMETAVGSYTADASGDVLFGWSGTPATVPGLFLCPDAACTNVGAVDGCWQLPTAATPVDPVGLRVNAGGLVVPLRCAMGGDGGTCSTTATQGCLSDADCPGAETCIGVGVDDDVICPLPDSALIACPIN